MKLFTDDALLFGELCASRREVVLALHRAGGSIQDPSGFSVRTLLEQTPMGFYGGGSGLMHSLERDGWIVRDVRGRKTMEILLVYENPQVATIVGHFFQPQPAPVAPEAPEDEDEAGSFDLLLGPEPAREVPPLTPTAYEVADAILARIIEIASIPTSEEVQQRLATALEENQRLRVKLESAQDEIVALGKQRDRLSQEKHRLETTVAQIVRNGDRSDRVFRELDRMIKEKPWARR